MVHRPPLSHLADGRAGNNAPSTTAELETVESCLSQLTSQLDNLSQEQLDRIFGLAADLQDEEGVYLEAAAGEFDHKSDDRGCDLLPIVLDTKTWNHLELGLSQRNRAWNRFLRDVYAGQEILRDEVVSYETVYGDSNFHRSCARMAVPPPSYLQFTGYDLQQDAQGNWLVMEDYLASAVGASYALKKRSIARQIAPRLFDSQDIVPIEDFTTQLLDVLQELVPQRAHVVLLSQGSADPHYLDHAAVARQMGVPIVQGSDLMVLDGRLYLKTITGVDRVDVVLRRLPTSLVDPVAFDISSRCGVFGLLSCVRKGSVAVANGLGSDLANNRALAMHMPAIIEYYLGEKPILKSPLSYELRDVDVRDEVWDQPEKYIVRHVNKRGAGYEWDLTQMDDKDRKELGLRVDSQPAEYTARRRVEGIGHACWREDGFSKAPVTLRAFGLGLDRISPCVLGWSGSPLDLTARTSTEILASNKLKDVWIQRVSSLAPVHVRVVEEEDPRRSRLTSRVAECLFWMGRYAERAEATTRALRVMQTQPWPSPPTPQARVRYPLWSALEILTGQSNNFFVNPGPSTPSPARLAHYLLLDRRVPGSVLSCLRSCRQNSENIREHLPPEVWSVLNRLYTQQSSYSDDSQSELIQQALEDRSIHGEIITQLDELTGALEKHMVHNDTWHFWQLGVSAERSVLTIQAVKQVLTWRNGAVPKPPGADPNLDSLLQILAGQYAYRSLYHARPVASKVAQLLLQDEDFPRSALFCVNAMSRALERTIGERPSRGAEAPLKHSQRIAAELNFIDIADCFPSPDARSPETGLPVPEFAEKLTDLTDLLLEFNTLISDHYLHHQVPLREPELFDLE